ncbi:hypothetical protein UFOVP435_14 [uncultured Caudovirales phage]|uniref:Uncharacterized protein n=1 Tax=uncultured Caudovirales phage TaxID=2100421 RepID=A0A6J5M7J0_9CAUD|nr:hypothetical protein UFOVP435_14 [uncultured Caudovirales phage]
MSKGIKKVAKVALPIAAAVFAPALLPGLAGTLGASTVAGLGSGLASLATGASPKNAILSGLTAGAGSYLNSTGALGNVTGGIQNGTNNMMNSIGGAFGMAPSAASPSALSVFDVQEALGGAAMRGVAPNQFGLAGAVTKAGNKLGSMWNKDPVGTTLLGVGALGMLGGRPEPQQAEAPQVQNNSALNQGYDVESTGRNVDVSAIMEALRGGPAGFREQQFLTNPITGMNQVSGIIRPRTGAATGAATFAEGGLATLEPGGVEMMPEEAMMGMAPEEMGAMPDELMAAMEPGDYIPGGGYVGDLSQGGGQDDMIQAMLSPGEYVFDATTVADLGDGNPEEGARKLDELRRLIAANKGRSNPGMIPPPAGSPMDYMAMIQ